MYTHSSSPVTLPANLNVISDAHFLLLITLHLTTCQYARPRCHCCVSPVWLSCLREITTAPSRQPPLPSPSTTCRPTRPPTATRWRPTSPAAMYVLDVSVVYHELLRLWAQVPEDICAIEVYYYYRRESSGRCPRKCWRDRTVFMSLLFEPTL